ncbi:MAG: DUF4245 family protein [Actinobacteria bacterium]|nr:DUF4245 domain-containing protein [Actinomycetota bacterium]MSV52522.1 DUF4245 family protein [Actinomycetota bacterium]MSW10642.1 DUF4245 family protein [Actinomycetota bacterium]
MTTPKPTGRPNARMRQTVGDMVRSMGLVLALIAVILLVTLRPQPDAVKVVDPTQVLISARALAPFAVEIPQGLAGYQVTSARWQETSASAGDPVLHLGYVTPGTEYVQFSQSAADNPKFIDEQTAGGILTDQVTLDGQIWQHYESPERRSLVRTVNGVTTVISGTTAQGELERVASSLTAG